MARVATLARRSLSNHMSFQASGSSAVAAFSSAMESPDADGINTGSGSRGRRSLNTKSSWAIPPGRSVAVHGRIRAVDVRNGRWLVGCLIRRATAL
jgi:hypothetical protein